MGLVTGGIFIVLGVFVLCVATFGIFRFEYALNRIHVAAKCDTLGSMLILAGLIISNGGNMESAKIGLILLFIWIGNPAASHMVARAEARPTEKTGPRKRNVKCRGRKETEVCPLSLR